MRLGMQTGYDAGCAGDNFPFFKSPSATASMGCRQLRCMRRCSAGSLCTATAWRASPGCRLVEDCVARHAAACFPQKPPLLHPCCQVACIPCLRCVCSLPRSSQWNQRHRLLNERCCQRCRHELQAVSQVQRQENEELRQRLQQLGEAWEQENAHVAQLRQQLAEAMATAGSGEAEAAARLQQAEAAAERRLQEAAEAARRAEQELAARCQMLAIEKIAHEQAAAQASAKAATAEERRAAAEARCRQLEADLDSASAGRGELLQSARRQAEAAVEAARKLQQELLEQRQRCEELEAALRGERERSSSQAERAKAAEQAQQGLGAHVKASHARLQNLQVSGKPAAVRGFEEASQSPCLAALEAWQGASPRMRDGLGC